MAGLNDKVLLSTFGCAICAVVLVAYAPSTNASGSIASQFWGVANSNFLTALAGAFAGAVGAQFIFERTSKRKVLIAEIREVNVAISITADVTNTYLVFKKQIVHPIYGGYQQALRARIAHPNDSTLSYQTTIDLRMFTAPFSPTDALQRSLQERVTPQGPALSFLTLLVQAKQNLDEALSLRNSLIEKIRQIPQNPVELDAAYFGLPVGTFADRSYPHYMRAIDELTNDCIGIGVVLCRILHDYGKEVAKSLGASAPKIGKAEWDIPETEYLIPDLKRYEQWISRSFRQEN